MQPSKKDADTRTDTVREAFLSEDNYDRIKAKSTLVFTGVGKIEHRLAGQAGLFLLLSLHFPLYVLLPKTDAIPMSDPAHATPKFAVLSGFSFTLTVIGGLALLFAIYKRLNLMPLTEEQARDIVALEGFGNAISLGTGLFAGGISTGILLTGLLGKASTYIGTTGQNPYATHAVAPSITTISTASLFAFVLLFFCRQYVTFRLRQLRTQHEAIF